MPSTAETILKASHSYERMVRAGDYLQSVAVDLAGGSTLTRAQVKAAFDALEGNRHEWLCQLAVLVDMDPSKDELDRDELETAFALKSYANEASRPDLISHDVATYRALVAAE